MRYAWVCTGSGRRWEFLFLDGKRQIQTNEVIHDALTKRRTAASIRSPLSPTTIQTVLMVIIFQTPNVASVETVIQESRLANENSVPDGRISSIEWRRLGSPYEASRRFLAALANTRNSLRTSKAHRYHHKPKSLPKNLDPMYSKRHSCQRGMSTAILTMVYFSAFRAGIRSAQLPIRQKQLGMAVSES